ncbi:MAG: hypothetical protein IJM95_03865 [Anaerotignum sp.]|nr:hypothetical protein [Anaerotignum sp.]
MAQLFNANKAKKCAICKNWYDPTNSAIAPVSPNVGLWEIKDIKEKKKCLIRNVDTISTMYCNKFESKL